MEHLADSKNGLRINHSSFEQVRVVMGPTFSRESLAVDEDPTWHPFYIEHDFEQIRKTTDAEAYALLFERMKPRMQDSPFGMNMYT